MARRRHLGAEVTGVCSTANVERLAHLWAYRVINRMRRDYSATRERHDVLFDIRRHEIFPALQTRARTHRDAPHHCPDGVLDQDLADIKAAVEARQ